MSFARRDDLASRVTPSSVLAIELTTALQEQPMSSGAQTAVAYFDAFEANDHAMILSLLTDDISPG